jgi:hypothetical protein
MAGFFVILALLLAGLGLALWSVLGWRSVAAKRLYLSQCDAALSYPHFANPEGRLDLRAKTVDGDKTAFEQYEWFVARLVYVLDECLMLAGGGRWRAVADTQLCVHKHYFSSDYYRKQDYLPHYSARMRALIEAQQA